MSRWLICSQDQRPVTARRIRDADDLAQAAAPQRRLGSAATNVAAGRDRRGWLGFSAQGPRRLDSVLLQSPSGHPAAVVRTLNEPVSSGMPQFIARATYNSPKSGHNSLRSLKQAKRSFAGIYCVALSTFVCLFGLERDSRANRRRFLATQLRYRDEYFIQLGPTHLQAAFQAGTPAASLLAYVAALLKDSVDRQHPQVASSGHRCRSVTSAARARRGP